MVTLLVESIVKILAFTRKVLECEKENVLCFTLTALLSTNFAFYEKKPPKIYDIILI